MKKVLVTGANGHVGNNLVRLLLSEGYSVRASVRDLNDPEKTKPLSDLGCELVQCDILKPETVGPAVDGMDGVFHVAAVYAIWARDPEKEIIAPSVDGARNVLTAAAEAGVKRAVLTSSCAAIGTAATADKPLTEADWSDASVNPYNIAKREAERLSWKLAEEKGLDLRVINPSGVLGPGFWKHTPTTEIIEQLIRKRLPVIPPLGFSMVDVRDVAKAHLLVYEKDEAEGRYITSTKFEPVKDLVADYKRLYPDHRFPKMRMPKSILPVISAGDWLLNKITGIPRQGSSELLGEVIDQEQHVDNSKLRALGWEPMDWDDTLRDTWEWTKKTFVDR